MAKHLSNEEILKIVDDGINIVMNELLEEAQNLWEPVNVSGFKHIAGKIETKKAHSKSQFLRKDPNRTCMYATTMIPYNVKIGNKFFEAPEEVPQWNSNVKSCKVLRRIDDNNLLLHIVSFQKGMGIMSSRDFIIVFGQKWFGEKRLLNYQIPIDSAEFPPVKEYVRGEIGPCGYIYDYVEENVTQFTKVANDDYQVPALVRPFYLSKVNESAFEDMQNVIRYLKGDKNIVTVDVKLPRMLTMGFGGR